MGGDLTIAIAVFLASAVLVMFCGAKLAVYGDALASLTGLGRLFVGSLLVALATSLPELSTNISAVQLDPPNPELAVGNVFGANMLNMFTSTAVDKVLEQNARTADIVTEGTQRVSTVEMGDLIVAAIESGN